MQSQVGAFNPSNVTTEVIQKYLDENKQLILAILDNQNLGKLNECAQYQAKLQSNLMYLAAIADSQPQQPTVHAQVPPAATVMQSGGGQHYMSQQQQLAQQSLMMARNPLHYTQSSLSSLHQAQQQQQQQQQQNAMHGHSSMNTGGNSSLQMLSGGPVLGGDGSLGYSDYGRSTGVGDGMQIGRGPGLDIRSGSKPDLCGIAGGGSANGQAGDEPEPSYLKASEEDGN